MSTYKDTYYQLAGRVADAIDLLTAAMQQGELAYLQSADMDKTNPILTNATGDGEKGTDDGTSDSHKAHGQI